MPLFETLVSTLGPGIAKTLLKVWAGDYKIASEAGESSIEALTKLIPEIRARNEAKRQLESIGERAAESLMFTFESEGKLLKIEDQEAVAALVGRTLDGSKIDTELLVQKDLDPGRLAQHFFSEASEQVSNLPEKHAQLFTRVIQEASQSIIDIARMLPGFTERTFSELLKQNRVLVNAADQILDKLDRIRTKIDDDREIEAARFETEYRRAVARNLNKLELFGVDLSRTSRSYPLSVAYVGLEVGGRTKEAVATIEIDTDEAEENDESGVDAVETALSESNRLVIRGPAGAGKTTLVHWIAVQAASRSFDPPLEIWNRVVPFLIRLRQFSDAGLPRPEQFPSLVAPSISDTMPPGWVHRVLQSGDAVVMVDGVDEVTEPRRAEVRSWLKDIVDTFPKCRFVVTSRPHAVEQNWLHSEGFLDADLQPMDMAGIETFIDHWHRAVREEVQREEEIASLDRLAENLKFTLRGNLAIRRLATNPLLCSVICALHRDTNEQLPEDRLDLYERCCSMLLERRDPESGLKLQGYPRLSYRQKRALLDDLAYWMVKNDWSEIPLNSAQDRLQKKIESLRSDERDGIALTGDTSLRFFLERSGILREPSKGRLDFAHRTFQEFMAANASVTEGDIGVLLSNAAKAQWREVIVLGAGLARPSERADLIKSLINTGDKDTTVRPQFYLLAVACLEAAVDVDNALRGEVEQRIGGLFPPTSIYHAMQIAEAAGEMAVPYLKRKRYLNSKQSIACVRALAMIGTPEAANAIAEYAKTNWASVMREVARTSARIDSELYVTVVAPHINPRLLSGDSIGQLVAKFGVHQIPGLEHARELWLTGSSASDFRVPERFIALRRLRLAGCAFPDLAPLADLPNLTSLTLDRVERVDLSPLKALHRVSNLELSRCSVDAAQLAGVTGITMLILSGAVIRNPDALSRLPNLRFLAVYHSSVDFAFLKSMQQIMSLSLERFHGDASVLTALNRLESLFIRGGNMGDLRWLSSLTKLNAISLSSVTISESAEFPKLPSLRSVRIEGTVVSPRLANEVRKNCPGALVSA